MKYYKYGVLALALGFFTLTSCDKDKDDDDLVWQSSSETEITSKLPASSVSILQALSKKYSVVSAKQNKKVEDNGAIYKVVLRPVATQRGGEIEIEFAPNGTWVEIENRNDSFIPLDVLFDLELPEAMIQTIDHNIYELESLERSVNNVYIAELQNDIKLAFDAQGNQISLAPSL